MLDVLSVNIIGKCIEEIREYVVFLMRVSPGCRVLDPIGM